MSNLSPNNYLEKNWLARHDDLGRQIDNATTKLNDLKGKERADSLRKR